MKLKWLLSLASVLLLFSLFEIGLRLFGGNLWSVVLIGEWEWIVSDPLLGWANRPDLATEEYRINSLGFRGGEITRRKPAGVVRIVCLGDSGTFGLRKQEPGIRAWDNYPAYLGKLMEASGNFEIVNAGVIGYSSSHGLRQLVLRVIDLDPDVVTVRFGFNAHSPSWRPSLRVAEPGSPSARALLYGSADWGLVRLFLLGRQKLLFMHPAPLTVPWASLERFEQDLERFVELSRERGFRLLMLDYPLRPLERGESLDEHESAYPLMGVEDLPELHRVHAPFQATIRKVAARSGTPFIDTETACLASAERCYNDYDLVHPNGFGARLIADRLYRELTGAAEPRAGPPPS